MPVIAVTAGMALTAVTLIEDALLMLPVIVSVFPARDFLTIRLCPMNFEAFVGSVTLILLLVDATITSGRCFQVDISRSVVMVPAKSNPRTNHGDDAPAWFTTLRLVPNAEPAPTGSQSMFVVAIYTYIAIWLHYFCTEKEDFKVIYGSN